MKVGDLVEGRFAIERLAGAGGMGSVYRATDRRTGQPVAVKALHRPDTTAARFEREAEVLARLEHPGIVRYVAHGRTEGGGAFLAIEWLDGVDSAARLAAGPMAIREAVKVVQRAAEALGAAHAQGVLHRDVKPGNIFLVGGAADAVKVLDFGVARLSALPGGTRTGALLGTPGYMAPEQARGERELGPQVDVFALGCVLFECLAGRPAFAGASPMAVLAKVLFDEAPRIAAERPSVPAALDALLARMLARSPADRPADGAAVAAALAALGEIATDEPPPSALPPSRSLSPAEARLVSVVVSGGTALTVEDALADTMGGDLLAPSVPAPLLALGARVTALADGSLVATASAAASAADQAAQAARVALALRALSPAVPIAVATARSNHASGERGDAIDHAAALLRLGGATAAIRVDEVTAGLVDGRFALGHDDHGPLLLGDLPPEGAPRAPRGKVTPFVEREREMGVLLGLFAECADEPAARAVLVTAAAGAGKSRLVRELAARLAGEHEAEVWIARGDPLRAGAPYALAGELVRRAAGAAPADPAEARRAFEPLLAAACARGPLVLVLEDLHAGDLPSLLLVDAALAALADRPLLVLAIGRPEVHDLFPRLWEERHVHEIRLADLGRRAAHRVAAAVLGAEAATPIVERVVARAGGSPFYLEELACAAARGDDAVPETVLALVEARLARLDADARRVLRAAAVFGERFPRAGAAALLGDAAGLDETLAHLVELEILERRIRGDLAFRSALLREAAYGMLTGADRALGHRLAASWLASAGEGAPEVVAAHLERAGEARAATAFWQRAAASALAVSDLAAAAEHAARGVRAGAEGEALGGLLLIEAEVCHWRADAEGAAMAARAAMAALPAASAAWFAAVAELSAALGRLGDAEALAALVEEALAAPARADERPEDVAVLYRAVVELLHVGRYPLAERLLARLGGVRTVASAEVRALGPTAAAQLGKARAAWATARGDVAAARRETELGIEAAVRAGDRPLACLMRANLSDAWLSIGGFAEAEATAREALAAAVEAGLTEVAAAARINLGIALGRQGRFAEARAALADAGDRSRTGAAAAIALADVCLAEGSLAEAERRAREAAQAAASIPPLRALAEATLARALLAQDRAAEAKEAAGRAMRALADLGKIAWGEAAVRLTWAEALAAAGDETAAREAIAAARDALAARAAAIGDPSARSSFLARVPENAATLARARAWLDPRRRG